MFLRVRNIYNKLNLKKQSNTKNRQLLFEIYYIIRVNNIKRIINAKLKNEIN